MVLGSVDEKWISLLNEFPKNLLVGRVPPTPLPPFLFDFRAYRQRIKCRVLV